MVKVTTIPALSDNYIYLLEYGGKGAVVDPGEASPVLQVLKDRKIGLEMILLTHHHPDHTAGGREIRSETGALIYGPDRTRIPGLDRQIQGEDRFDFGPSVLHVLATPGHTSNGLSFYMPSAGPDANGLLFTGDTLFAGGCGRLFECGPEVMWGSLSRLAEHPDRTLVYCGHEYTVENYEFASSIEPNNDAVHHRLLEVRKRLAETGKTVPSNMGDEKKTNPFLRSTTREMRSALNLPGADDVAVFAELRRRKDLF